MIIRQCADISYSLSNTTIVPLIAASNPHSYQPCVLFRCLTRRLRQFISRNPIRSTYQKHHLRTVSVLSCFTTKTDSTLHPWSRYMNFITSLFINYLPIPATILLNLHFKASLPHPKLVYILTGISGLYVSNYNFRVKFFYVVITGKGVKFSVNKSYHT